MRKKIMLSALLMGMTLATMAQETEEAPKHWTKKGNASLQFTQGFVSKNWYKGGVSSFSLLATADYIFNYKLDKFTWDNHLEGKLGFINSNSQFRTFITNNDLMKWTTKFGYEAGHNWYYTLQGIGQTQFCTGWKDNGDDTATEISKFFNPAYLNVSLGMDWKKDTEKISWTLYVSPIAYNLVFVSDPLRGSEQFPQGHIDGGQFGLKYGDYNLYDFGATAKAGMIWKACKYLTWTSQATYFSPLYDCGKYKNNVYTRVEWENTFDMPLNKYFSTKVYTNLRFDDSVAPENKGEGWGYFQFTELLSFGISYNW